MVKRRNAATEAADELFSLLNAGAASGGGYPHFTSVTTFSLK